MGDPETGDAPQGPIRIRIGPRGTIIIEGTVIIRDREGKVIPQPPSKYEGTVKLCGCGRSNTKPFCDGSHKEAPLLPPTGSP